MFGFGKKLDLASITSKELAEQEFRKRHLEKIFLFPHQLGGQESEMNIVYVPLGIHEAKDLTTDSLITMLEKGLIENLNVKPEYKGNSFIPSKIHLIATNSEKKNAFQQTIDIW